MYLLTVHPWLYFAESIIDAGIKKGDHVQAMLITWAGTATTKDGREFLTNRTTIVRMQKDYYQDGGDRVSVNRVTELQSYRVTLRAKKNIIPKVYYILYYNIII